MSSAHRTYRLCSFDSALRTVTADLIDATNDEDAIARAHAAGLRDKCEIWDGNRLVAELDGERRKA